MNTWILICNEKKYDIDGAFRKFKRIDWRQVQQLNRAEVGDDAYIYISSPKMIIAYKARIIRTGLLSPEIDDSEFCKDLSRYRRYMEIEFVEQYYPNKIIRRKDLIDHGLVPKNPMPGPMLVKGELKEFLESLK